MLLHPTRATRRTTLAVAVAGLTLGGCTSGSDDTKTSAPSPGDDTRSDRTADEELVDRVVAALGAAVNLVDRTRRDHPRLARELAPLLRLHRDHLASLERDAPAGIATTPPRPAVARARVLAGEKSLQRTLTAASVEAESGSLAGLLASMAAAVAQHRTALG